MVFGTMGTQELLIIGMILVLLFGASNIPKLARSFGRAKGEYNSAIKEVEEEVKKGEDETTARAGQVAPMEQASSNGEREDEPEKDERPRDRHPRNPANSNRHVTHH